MQEPVPIFTCDKLLWVIFVGYVCINVIVGEAAVSGFAQDPIGLFFSLGGVSVTGAVVVACMLVFNRKQLQLSVITGVLIVIGLLVAAWMNLLWAHWASGAV